MERWQSTLFQNFIFHFLDCDRIGNWSPRPVNPVSEVLFFIFRTMIELGIGHLSTPKQRRRLLRWLKPDQSDDDECRTSEHPVEKPRAWRRRRGVSGSNRGSHFFLIDWLYWHLTLNIQSTVKVDESNARVAASQAKVWGHSLLNTLHHVTCKEGWKLTWTHWEDRNWNGGRIPGSARSMQNYILIYPRLKWKHVSPEWNPVQTLQKSFGWDYKPRSSVCIRGQKDHIRTLKILRCLSGFGGLWKP